MDQASDPDTLANRSLDDPEGRAVILYENPVTVLAARLEAGDRLADAIEDWCRDTERLLAVFRRDRRRVTLVDGHAASAAPALFQRLLGARLSAPVPGGEVADIDSHATPAGLPHLIAAQALRQHETAAPLATELEAGSLPLGPAYQVDVDATVEEWNAPAVAPEPPPELDELKEENELLLLQLRQVQEELETHFLENRKLNRQLDEVRSQVDQARTTATRVERQRDSLEAEFNEARAAWRNERKSLTDRLTWTVDDLAAVRRSLSWKLTEPLRRLLGLFTGGTKL